MTSLFSSLRKIRIHPFLWAVFILAIFTAHFHEVISLFTIIFIHEMGHTLAAQHFSWRVKKITFLPFGGVAETEEHGNRPLKEEMIVTLAGPFQHVWIGGLVYLFKEQGWMSLEWYHLIQTYNIMIVLFNLIPIWPLDGGKLLHVCISHFLPYLTSMKYMLIWSACLLSAFSLSVLFIAPNNLNIWMVVVYLAFSLYMEWKQLYFVFIRFLLDRYYGRKNTIKGLITIYTSQESYLFEVLEQFKRGSKHPIVIRENGKEVGTIDENEILHAYFAEKQIHAKVKDIMIQY